MIVLDTNALLWVLGDSPRLGHRAAAVANQALAAELLWTSAITFWEIALLTQRNRVRMAFSAGQFRSRVQSLGIQEAAITGDIALEAARLASSLKDPADCFVAATAMIHHAKVMTADARLLDSGVVATIDARR